MDLPLAPTSLRDGLLAEHAAIADCLDRVIAAVGAGDRDASAKGWICFRTKLSAHLEAEDVQLIPALPRARETSARVLGQEHNHLRERVRDLSAAGSLDATHLTDLRLLRDILKAHARNDDRLLYQWAETNLPEQERARAIEALSFRLIQARER